MLFFRNSKAQMSAPFELLVAVIIMGFVIVVGMQALEQLRVEQCKGQIQKSMQDFKSAIEESTNLGTPQNFIFAPPSCFHLETSTGRRTGGDEISVKRSTNSFLCSRLCGGTKNECVLMEYFSQEYSERVCINISPVTYFISTQTGDCPAEDDPSKYDPVDPAVAVLRGNYTSINQKETGDPFDTMCLYRRK
ncbi:MAG: hypothetical protein Q7S92_07200 [Candidatus Diapherotrites archaeon]|nr:hypothetical protein [Candidatus Diapherotrites archaeon]